MNKRQLFEAIMKNVSKSVLESLEDIEFGNTKLRYNKNTGKYEKVIDKPTEDSKLSLDSDNQGINYKKSQINNTVVVDPIQSIIVSMKTEDDIKRFFTEEKKKIIETNGGYAQEFIDIVGDMCNELGILAGDDRDKRFSIMTGYNGFSYKTEDKWKIVKTGQQYKIGQYYNWRNEDFTVKTADHNLLVHKVRTGHDSGPLKEPRYKYEELYGKEIDQAMMQIVNDKGTYDYWIGQMKSDILNSRIVYMKEHGLFDTEGADKLYKKYGVDKEPNDWFVWAKQFIPKYLSGYNYIPVRMAGWYGGVTQIKKEKGRDVVVTYLTNDDSDSCGENINLADFAVDRTLSYREAGYSCVIYSDSKIKMFKIAYDYIRKQIDLGNVQ